MIHSKEQEDNRPTTHGLLTGRQLQRAAILLAVLIGFALRFFRLDFHELSELEGAAYVFSQLPFIVQTQFFLEQGEPFLHGSFLLQNVWHSITGTSVFAWRAISALCSFLVVPLAYRFAKEMKLGKVATFAATLWVAMNYSAIWDSQTVLLHSLSLLLTTTSAVLALKFIGGRESRETMVVYVLCTAASFYTHAFAALALLAQNLYVLFLLARDRSVGGRASSVRPARSLLLRWTVSQIAIGALCAPWLVSAWPTITDFTELALAPASSPWPTLVRGLGRTTIGLAVPEGIWLLSASLLAIAIITSAILGPVLAVWRETDRRRKGASVGIENEQQEISGEQKAQSLFRGHNPTVLLLLYVLVSWFTYWVRYQVYPFFLGSAHGFALAPFLLLLVVGLANIGNWVEGMLGPRWKTWTGGADTGVLRALNRTGIGNIAAASLILVIVAGNMFSLRNYYFDPPFTTSRGLRELSDTLDRWSAGLDPAEVRFAQIFPDPALWNFYYSGEVEHISLPPWPFDSEGALEAVDIQRSSGVQRILLLIRSEIDQDDIEIVLQSKRSRLDMEIPSQGQTLAETTDIARQALASSYQFAGQETVGPWLAELYARPHPQLWRLSDVEFANGLTLERAQVSPDFPPSGGRLVVHTEWSGDPASLTGGEKLFLHLLDESGNLVAQWDPEFRMDSSQVLTSVAMPIPSTLPAGPMRLIAGLYDVNTKGAPRILTESGEESLLLVFFQVTECDACGR